ncbi:hypothetical protein ACOMHN_007066 [Nucella lapillus]
MTSSGDVNRRRESGRVGNLLPPHCLTRVEHGKGFSVTYTQEDHPPLASRGNLVPPQDVTGVQHRNGFSETTTRSALLNLNLNCYVTVTTTGFTRRGGMHAARGQPHRDVNTGGAPVSSPPPGTGVSRDQCQRAATLRGEGGTPLVAVQTLQ